MRVDEVAKALGVTARTVQAWVRQGNFPPGRALGVGRRPTRVWFETDVCDWFESRAPTKNTAAENGDTLVA